MDEEFIMIATAFLEAVTAELDPHTSDKGIIVTNDAGQTVSLFTPGHIQFAKYGRAPGKQPPVEEILEWITTSGKIKYDSYKDAEGTAWAIAKSIAKKGTKNYVPGAPNAMEEAINLNLKKYYDELNQRVVKLSSETLGEFYKREFPEDVDFKI